MGLFQPHGGYRRCHGQAEIGPVVIHGLSDALAAIDAARAANEIVDLISPPGASRYIGPAMFKTIVDEARLQGGDHVGTIYYDCGASRGHALAALRKGLRQLCLEQSAINPAILDIAAQHGATLASRQALMKL